MVDTSVFIDLERRRQNPAATLARAYPDAEFAMAAITAAEILAGAQLRPRASPVTEAVLQAFPVVPFDLGVARHYARIWAYLRRSGQSIGSYDLLIAATALAHGFDLLTLNTREFRRIPGLQVLVPPWSP